MKRRVVITGLGAVSPVGNNVNDMWEAIKAGKNGIDYIKSFDTSNMRVKIAGEIKNLDFGDYLDPKEYRRNDRVVALGLIAAKEAYLDSNLDDAEFDRYRFGTFVSSGIGGVGTIYEQALVAKERGGDRVSPFFVPSSIINLVGGNIAIKYKAKGPNLPIVTACSSGADSIGLAFQQIRDNYLDLAFAGAAEAAINILGVGGFSSMKALCFSNEINAASLPFDKRRSGFVLGEGAGVLILEEYEHAKKRGAKIYAEVLGYGSSCDAYHITAPDETAEGITKAIVKALEDGGVHPEEVDYFNAHGTGTYYNDRLETLGIKKAFKDHAYKLNISSTKSMLGHLLGASGAVESIVTVLSVRDDIVSPTINYQEFDEECNLNYTPNKAVLRKINYAINNNVGFGGQNSTILFKKYVD